MAKWSNKLKEIEKSHQEMKRQAFEKSYLNKHPYAVIDFANGLYLNRRTQGSWEMWEEAQEQMLQAIHQSKVVCAIENAVQDQVEASGVKAELHRLDGEKIVDVIVESINFLLSDL